jgi:nucleoside recognition membrane protein YjiH
MENAKMNKAIQFLGVSFILIFAFMQFLDWSQQVTIPVPMLILSGVGLAALSAKKTKDSQINKTDQ